MSGVVQVCPPGCCDGVLLDTRLNLLDALVELHSRGRCRKLPYNASAAEIHAATVALGEADQ